MLLHERTDSWTPQPVEIAHGHALEVAKSYDDLAERYDSFHVDAKSLAENRYVKDALRRVIDPAGRVADIGCGTGLLLELLDLAPNRYAGIDVSTGMLARAQAKFPQHRFIAADAQQEIPGLKDCCTDAVVSLFGAPSYCDLKLFWDETQRILRPGGAYFLMFCGPSYVNRSTYINKGNGLLNAYSEAQIISVCSPERIWGTSRLIDMLPKWLPGPAFDAALVLEEHTLGRVARDECFFIYAAGHKPL